MTAKTLSEKWDIRASELDGAAADVVPTATMTIGILRSQSSILRECAAQLRDRDRPRPIATEPPGVDDEWGRILIEHSKGGAFSLAQWEHKERAWGIGDLLASRGLLASLHGDVNATWCRIPERTDDHG